jgi:addiction module RelB/DinJ family antitoxin
MKDSVIRARIDSDLKARASKVLASCGLEPSDAIRLFLQQVVAHQGIPFSIRAAEVEAPAEALHEMKRAAQDRDREIAASEDVSEGKMFLIRPESARHAKIRWPKAKRG